MNEDPPGGDEDDEDEDDVCVFTLKLQLVFCFEPFPK